MADADEPVGEHVQEEAPEELLRGQRHDLHPVPVRVVLPPEPHHAVRQAEQTVVGERHAMGVAAQIVQDLGGTAEGRLGVDDPGLGLGVAGKAAGSARSPVPSAW